MKTFLVLNIIWAAVLLIARHLYNRVQKQRHSRPAHYVSNICNHEYFEALSPAQMERLVLAALEAHGYTLLGKPFLGAAASQGYAWRAGRRYAVYLAAGTLDALALAEIAAKGRGARADRVLVVCPYAVNVPAAPHTVELVGPRNIAHWFRVLDNVRPPLPFTMPKRKCECGSMMEARVSRLGQPLLVCPRVPDCRAVLMPGLPGWDAAQTAGHAPA